MTMFFIALKKINFIRQAQAKLQITASILNLTRMTFFGMDENCNFKQYKPRGEYKNKEKAEDNRINLFESEVDSE